MTEAGERVAWNDDGTLDEVFGARHAHLEHMGGGKWYLSVGMSDGRDVVFWFKSKDLRKPYWEERKPSPTAREQT